MAHDPRPTAEGWRRWRRTALTAWALVTLGALVLTAPAHAQNDLPPLPEEPAPTPAEARYALSADPGDPLRGIRTLRLQVAMSAPDAEACAVEAAALETAAATPLRAANLTVVAGANLDARAAAAVPEVFVALTIVRDETGLCAASLATELGLDTNVVLVHRNVDSPPGSLRLSNAYVELGRVATLLLGVPPTFGEQVLAGVGQQVSELANRIVSAGAARP